MKYLVAVFTFLFFLINNSYAVVIKDIKIKDYDENNDGVNDGLNLHFNFTNTGNGSFHLSDLNIGYDVDFVVDTNPSASGNLANVLNQLQTAGTGNILIDLPFLSTQNGTMKLSNLMALLKKVIKIKNEKCSK